MRTILRTAALSAVALMTATACGGQGSPAGGEGPDPADADLTVVTGVYPLEWLAREVGGEGVAVVQLTEPGMEPHDLELTGRQIGELTEADLAFYVAGLQPAVDEAVEQEASDRALDVADVVELHPAGEGGHEHGDEEAHGHEEDAHGHEEDAHAEEEHSEEDAHAEEGAGGDGHDHGDLDPHFWLDVDLMSQVAGALGERLGELNPEAAAEYTANAEAVTAELEAIGQEYEDGLASCEHNEVVVGHTAFSYLTEHYGLEQVGISGVDPDSEPSPSQIAEIADFVEEHGVTTIFTEPLMPEETAQTIAGETGAAVEVLDPLEGVTDASPGDDYPSIMRGNLETLRTALACS
ncbi:metal ABC transporter substrate-binding protein [Nocardiopsis changdeensis]|uniref:Zinc ABC transporter substrate-binding protein n=1 Tax=Nocardiopsis changdeensis TaxID=2831969 RepID=A0ABX8BKQ5_9ACTN|nr:MULTISPECIES: metal ABC transporter substrate-binding protein [Nocardiopsis]QUX21607.1 zinc ABC transporter substrate-binding protein [Nocardiopsis changdeensis]QYX37542.1 metal ABC transporter substrate-binding protein [Nocardiopsis sp. MT53]